MSSRTQKADILILDGRIYDGTGAPWFPANITVKDGCITSVGAPSDYPAVTRIEAKNHVISPGFVDVHIHDKDILSSPSADNLLRQGITTVVSGNCGSSGFPISDHLESLHEAGPAVNYATLVGHGTIRREAMGMSDRKPGEKDILSMCSMAERAMKEGAIGLSSGLFYVPGAWADCEEVTAIARVVSRLGGIYSTHKRSAGGKIFEAIDEAATIGKNAEIRVEISHLKILHRRGRTKNDRAEKVIEHIDNYRQNGVDIAWDLHPYTATSTSLSAVILPEWVSKDGKLEERLKDSHIRKRIYEEVKGKIAWIGGPDKISIADDSYGGKTLEDVAGMRGNDYVLTGMDLVEERNPTCIFHALRQEDVDSFLTAGLSSVASDGGAVGGRGIVHPRNFGCFPKVIADYAIKRQLLSMEQVIQMMTYVPARRFGINDRGRIAKGMKADIVIFEPDSLKSNADFKNPRVYPEGIKRVIVNGRTAWECGTEEVSCWGHVLGIN